MPVTSEGARVAVRPPTSADAAAYVEAVTLSAPRLRDFAVPDATNFPAILASQTRTYRTFLMHALDPEGAHGLVGRVNVANVVGGAFRSATIGYDAYDPYAGRGLFAEGLRLVLDLLFDDPPTGMGLHRVEANIQPANTRSAGLVRSLGFVHEGFSRDFLHLPGIDGRNDWRDHDRYTLLATDWPARPYRDHARPRIAALVSGMPGSGKSTLARQLASELGLPLLGKDIVKEAVADHLDEAVVRAQGSGQSRLGAGASAALWALLGASSTGGVVESWFWPHDEPHVRAGLMAAGFDPSLVPEVFCDVPMPVARERFEARARAGLRHQVHGTQIGLEWWDEVGRIAGPLGIGLVTTVDTLAPVTPREVTRISLTVRAAYG